MQTAQFKIGEWNGEPAIIGPGGPYLYGSSEKKKMQRDCREMNAKNFDPNHEWVEQ